MLGFALELCLWGALIAGSRTAGPSELYPGIVIALLVVVTIRRLRRRRMAR